MGSVRRHGAHREIAAPARGISSPDPVCVCTRSFGCRRRPPRPVHCCDNRSIETRLLRSSLPRSERRSCFRSSPPIGFRLARLFRRRKSLAGHGFEIGCVRRPLRARRYPDRFPPRRTNRDRGRSITRTVLSHGGRDPLPQGPPGGQVERRPIEATAHRRQPGLRRHTAGVPP